MNPHYAQLMEALNFDESVMQRLADCAASIPGIRRAWRVYPFASGRMIIDEDMPCAIGMEPGPTFTPPVQSRGRFSQGRVYVQRFIVKNIGKGVDDPAMGAEAINAALPLMTRVKLFYKINAQLQLEGEALRYCQGISEPGANDTGVRYSRITGDVVYAYFDLLLPVVMQANINARST